MNQRSNDYFVKINPQFLFNTQGMFKSYFTPWVYLYLKLEKNMLISKQIHNEFKINQKDLAEFFMVNRTTIYRAIHELLTIGCIVKSGNKYRIYDEQPIINLVLRQNKAKLISINDIAESDSNEEIQNEEQTKETSLDKLPEFIKVYQNEFLKLRTDVLNVEENFKEYPRTVIKIIEIYYYLIACNRHCLLPDIDLLESEETRTSICRNLNHDNRLTRAMLDVLHNLDYIAIYKNGSMATIKKKITGNISSGVNNERTVRANSFDKRMATEHQTEEVKRAYHGHCLNEASNEAVAFEDTFDFAGSFSGNQEKPKDVNTIVKTNRSEDIVAEEVTYQERLGYMFDMCKKNVDKFIEKANELNIPEEEVDIWLQNNRAA